MRGGWSFGLKTIGLIGGLSWESSAEYYRMINEAVKQRLGGLHSAQTLMFSFDFAEIERLQHAGDWDAATARMIDAAQRLERGGADLLLICSNTMHRMAQDVQADPSASRSCTSPTRLPSASRRRVCSASGYSARATRWSRTSIAGG